jgi:sporulation protein YlmC with PRC-barrel domain
MNGKANLVRMSWLTLALVPLLIGIASAANLNQSPTDQQMNQATNPNQPIPPSDQAGLYRPTLERAHNLIGAKVVNDKGEELGTISDIVLTPDHSGVSYAVLSHGGAWGTHGKLFAVPWAQFQIRPGEKVLVLTNVSKADLERAKGFDTKHWPATADENWLGITPEGGAAPAAPGYMPPSGYVPPSGDQTMTPAPGTQPRMDQYPSGGTVQSNVPARTDERYGMSASDTLKDRRVSELTGKKVDNLQGEKLGKLNDVVIDARQGKVAFGILSLRGMGRDYAAVPWSAFQFTGRPEMIRLDTTPQTLASIAFKGDNFPNLADPQYSRQLFDRFHVTPYWQTFGFVPGTAAAPGAPAASLNAPNAAQTIHGIIDSLGTYTLPGTSVPGLLLNVRTDDGRIVAVQAGPRAYAEKENFVFHQGDEVTIIGSPMMAAGQNFIMASQIKLGDRTLNLLSKDGKPLWNINELQSANEVAGSRELDQSRAPVGSNY